MGLEETKQALDNLKQKYQDSFFLYATKYYLSTLSFCIDQLDESKKKEVLNTLPEETRKVILKMKNDENSYEVVQDQSSDKLRKMEVTLKEKEIGCILSRADIIKPEDFVQLQIGMENLSYEELNQIYNEKLMSQEPSDKWLVKQIKTFFNKSDFAFSMSMGQINAVKKKLSLAQLHSVYVLGDEQLKNALFGSMSQDAYSQLTEDFSRMPVPSQETYNETLKIIDDYMDSCDETDSRYNRLETYFGRH